MTRMPAVQDQVVTRLGHTPSKHLNPEEIVAMGAAVRSGIMGREPSTLWACAWPATNGARGAIEIYQDGSEVASKSRRLGRFVLGDLRAATRGTVRVEVS